jgi:metal-responsive CopG/Arc/MetJ family transcriptional regulator
MMTRQVAFNPADLKQHRLAVRLPAWLLAEIDQEVDRLRALRPGGSLNRSDVVREILAHVLGERQQEQRPTTAPEL